MKYALLTKIGGELIEASKADYQDYYGFLKCPICNEPVFLRKSHLRNAKEITASFVHHKAVPEISACELRVGNYSKEDIESFAVKAKKQRLQKLSISLWKYLKTNMAVNFKSYEPLRIKIKNDQLFQTLVVYGNELLTLNTEYIVYKMIPLAGEMIENKDNNLEVIPQLLNKFNDFMNDLKSDWLLHEKIAQESAELFLSPPMNEIRHRVLTILCYPNNMRMMNKDLIELPMGGEEWRQVFVDYLTQEIALIFLSVNWMKLLS